MREIRCFAVGMVIYAHIFFYMTIYNEPVSAAVSYGLPVISHTVTSEEV